MIIQGNALDELKKLDANSVDCVVTSPPYWSLRKYDIPDVDWGDWRGQLGLEPTFDLYLKHLLSIFDEVKRVLKKEGTCWVNIGDSYWSAKGSCYNPGGGNASWKSWNEAKYKHPLSRGNKSDIPWMPPKSLCLIPSRFSIAMVDRGWILRNQIIWFKRNCMPSSAKDRFTVDYEPVFFFVKSRKYWFEPQVEQCQSGPSDIRKMVEMKDRIGGKHKILVDPLSAASSTTHIGQKRAVGNPNGRNRRCVWDCPTQPYPESHFATFPEALVEPMIKAGCPKGGIVLDPFCGSGTVLKVAEKLQRQAIGIDLGYQELAEKRKQWNQVDLIC